MALERLTLAPPSPVDGHPNAVTISNGVDGADDGNRAPRLPRWTRQEILVLIQGKKVAESRVRRGRTAGSAFGSNLVEPKWASVSSYCKRHGANRGPVQCRKRWSNLAGDFKKIKEWESQISEEGDSFWIMRNDLRRERKLPGFFDREVYEILDGGTITSMVHWKDKEGVVSVAEEEEAVFDSRIAAAEDVLLSNFEHSRRKEAKESPEKETVAIDSPKAISEKQYQPICKGYLDQGKVNERWPTLNPEKGSTSQEGLKRRRLSSDEGGDINLLDQWTEVLEKNNRILTTQLEAQKINWQLDRDHRKDQADSLVSVLSKLADALGRIADKL